MDERRFEFFQEQWNDLSRNEKICLYNEYCRDTNRYDDVIDTLDEEFFDLNYANNPYNAARDVACGNVDWSDDYIRYNGYGNLESLSGYKAEEIVNDYVEEIYEWDNYDDYINMDDFVEDEEDDEMKMEGDI